MKKTIPSSPNPSRMSVSIDTPYPQAGSSAAEITQQGSLKSFLRSKIAPEYTGATSAAVVECIKNRIKIAPF